MSNTVAKTKLTPIVRMATGISREEPKPEKLLKYALNYVALPVSLISSVSSITNFVQANFLSGENELVDKVATLSNRASYFVNGLYGSTDSAISRNTTGVAGFGLVSLASIIGNRENMYFLKGPGSALDQLPGMLEDAAYNPEIMKRYNLKPGQEKEFNKYKGFWDSFEKTIFSSWVVCKDIARDLKERTSKDGVLNAIKGVFITDKRRAERNLVTSTLGILTGVFLGSFKKLFTLGASLRDIFGIHADLAVYSKGFSYADNNKTVANENGQNKKSTGLGNLMYKYSGALYTVGSLLDLVYRWTGMSKLETLAVGIDNAGFLFMNLGLAKDNEAARLRDNKTKTLTTEQQGVKDSGETIEPKIVDRATRAGSSLAFGAS